MLLVTSGSDLQLPLQILELTCYPLQPHAAALILPDLHHPGIASRPNLPDCDADLCPGDTQTCLTIASPTSPAHDHEPSTSTFGHLPMQPLTLTAPTKFTADRTGAVPHQPLTDTAIVSESTVSYSRPSDLMTLCFSPPKRFLGFKHQLSKPRIIATSPTLTPRDPALFSSSKKMTIPRVVQKYTCGPTHHAGLVLGRVPNPKTPLPNLSPYQAPPPNNPHICLGSLFGNYLLPHSPRLFRSHAQLRSYDPIFPFQGPFHYDRRSGLLFTPKGAHSSQRV
ncbi:hypothetical protein CSKR_201672 [Clonorchis sinensis]|uniref:Uncharacterized protein n=1 Tax=Clonorchis sinensis TaxID=79923 RepID=A0A8T1MUI4_CLOSI|nr:hypothetical protein CSKR_201672 [Clonorchis sinensis]